MGDCVNYLRAYRITAQLSQQELGDLVGVARQTISAWEQGKLEVGVGQLMKISRALQVPLELLLESEGPVDSTVLFRANYRDALTSSYRRLVARKIENYAQFERIVEELSVSPMSAPLMEFKPELIEEEAQRIRAWLGVGDAPLENVLELLEGAGLKVLLERLPGAIPGFSAVSEHWGSAIIIDTSHPQHRQYFTALHELGHLIFHRSEYGGLLSGERDSQEKIVNHFAGAILLPRSLMEREFRGFKFDWIPDVLLRDMRAKYGVSERTVLSRAKALGIISEKQASRQKAVIDKSNGSGSELPHPVRVQSRLVRLAYRALLQEEISPSRAAEILRVPLVDIRRGLANYLTNPAA